MNYMHIPRKRLPTDLQDGVLEAISIQALGQVFITQGLQFFLSFDFYYSNSPESWISGTHHLSIFWSHRCDVNHYVLLSA